MSLRTKLIVLLLAVIGVLATWIYVLKSDIRGLESTANNRPKTINQVRTVTVQGPTQIVTKVIERPTGEKETTTTVVDAGYTVSSDSSAVQEPLAPKIERKNRVLVGFSNEDFSLRDAQSYKVWGGYSFGNRLDLLGGVGYEDKFKSEVLVVFRF